MDAIAPVPVGEGPVRGASPAWLADHLNDELLIPDCRPNVHEQISGHIPGTVCFSEAVGATPDRTIACSRGTRRGATNEFLILHYPPGHTKARLGQGSYTGWIGRPENPTVSGQDAW